VFTGIIQEVGQVREIAARGGDVRLAIACGRIARDRLNLGDSVAVNGVCLTVAAITADVISADVSRETLEVTTLGALSVGAAVNLEPALRVGDPLGGHWVSGHVDGCGEVLSATADARSQRLLVRVPPEIARYIARKGSVTLDGVSLTVNEVTGNDFGINLIPHTLTVTTLGSWTVGRRINVEIDVLARYAERLLGQSATQGRGQ
jgi:riboflavin synthase